LVSDFDDVSISGKCYFASRQDKAAGNTRNVLGSPRSFRYLDGVTFLTAPQAAMSINDRKASFRILDWLIRCIARGKTKNAIGIDHEGCY